ncbi:DUF2652 domain-containing protein [Muricauda brasiliensis]|uniref:DUF2652 domain-containing protein n=1 Tax=Muricauda brasiliensis TaxID=2162892 RepID=UPI000D3DB147|nr:DUF2652 domain-containing protein [Muricauda brasiliensis]
MHTGPTLICIPDISGFTRFMGEIDFELSTKIIPSLLNKIIYSNEIGLKISEIEGDAVLFYRTGELPSLKDLIDQCIYFYTEFYKQMNVLRSMNNGHKGVDKIPELLGLKIILHYGEEVGLVPIGKNIKLMGEDIIVAHRLLKNTIPTDEYILFSRDILSSYSQEDRQELQMGKNLISGNIQVDHLGQIDFKYIDLLPFRPDM